MPAKKMLAREFIMLFFGKFKYLVNPPENEMNEITSQCVKVNCNSKSALLL